MTVSTLFGGPDNARIDLALNAVRNPVAVGVGIDLAAATRTGIGLVRVRRTAVARVDRSIAVGVRIADIRHTVRVAVRRRAVRDLIRVLDPVLVAVDVRADCVRTVVDKISVELVRLRIVRDVPAQNRREQCHARKIRLRGDPAGPGQTLVADDRAARQHQRVRGIRRRPRKTTAAVRHVPGDHAVHERRGTSRNLRRPTLGSRHVALEHAVHDLDRRVEQIETTATVVRLVGSEHRVPDRPRTTLDVDPATEVTRVVVQHAVLDQHRRITYPDARTCRRIGVPAKRRTRAATPNRQATDHRVALQAHDRHHRNLEISTVQHHARRIRGVSSKHEVFRAEVDRLVVDAWRELDHPALRNHRDRLGDGRVFAWHVENAVRAAGLVADVRNAVAVFVRERTVQNLPVVDDPVAVAVGGPFDKEVFIWLGLAVVGSNRIERALVPRRNDDPTVGIVVVRRLVGIPPTVVGKRHIGDPFPSARRLRGSGRLEQTDPTTCHTIRPAIRDRAEELPFLKSL